MAFLALLAALVVGREGRAQQSFATGQSISPAYEGWVQNDDGSFDLMFGYMNRNWEEAPEVPVGPDNAIEPGGPDRGQPTRFQPRRNRFVFSIRVPADFGDRELVWTLTVNGQTHRAYATLKRDYYIDELVIQANFGAAGAAGSTPELARKRRAGAGRRGRVRAHGAGWASRWGWPRRSPTTSSRGRGPLAPTNPRRPGPHHHRHRDRPAVLNGSSTAAPAGRPSTRRRS